MLKLKVLHISASGKSALVSVSKEVGIFTSVVATGNLKITDGAEVPGVGSIIELPAGTKVSTIESPVEGEDKSFTWVVLAQASITFIYSISWYRTVKAQKRQIDLSGSKAYAVANPLSTYTNLQN